MDLNRTTWHGKCARVPGSNGCPLGPELVPEERGVSFRRTCEIVRLPLVAGSARRRA